MRRIRGLVFVIAAVLFGLGQAAAMAACPMQMAALAMAQQAAQPPCHPPSPDPAPAEASKGHLGACLCAFACHALGAPPAAIGVGAPMPAVLALRGAPLAWADAASGLDPPVPKAAA